MNVSILGIPMDLGAGRRGVDMGPSALRYAQIAETLRSLGHEVKDHGNVLVPVVETIDHSSSIKSNASLRSSSIKSNASLRSSSIKSNASLRSSSEPHYLEQIRSACQEAAERLQAMPADSFPICIGGDHSMAMGTVAGVTRGLRTGLIWVDAHTDFNVPDTSPSGNIHGMPVAHLVGLGDTDWSTLVGLARK